MTGVRAQVVATGHVFAEVVESVSASAKVTTGFDLNNSGQSGIFSATNLNLGTITIHTGKDVACNVSMQADSLTDARGNDLEVETAFSASQKKEAAGNKTLQLKAKARTRSGQASGVYKGTYTMVFAYN